MAGNELVTEGFKPGQVGSSAMPHKMNTRSCERVNGLAVVLRGYASMVGELAGDQWNEGDVSCSVVRRVALPDAFYAADGLFETFLTVLDEFGVFPAVVQRELDRYLPVPGHDEGLGGRREGRGGPRGRPRDHRGARRRGRPRDAREGHHRQRPLRPSGRRRPARPHRGRPDVARRRAAWSSPGPPPSRCARSSPASTSSWPRIPRPRRTHRKRFSDAERPEGPAVPLGRPRRRRRRHHRDVPLPRRSGGPSSPSNRSH